MKPKTSFGRRYGWLLLILMAAACLRLYDIAETPPGLTHDEADHAITAWEIVNGAREIYFTVGYGREPLFDYSTAFLMSFLGPTYLAGRLASVYFSLILIAATFAWVRAAFDETTGLLTMAGLAVGFWPLMTSRQSLRSESLPALFALSVFFFWQGWRSAGRRPARTSRSRFLIAGLLLGLAYYTYIPARILWAIFPLLLLYLALANRRHFRRIWRGTTLMLFSAAVVGSPLFYYLVTHPEAEARIRQLRNPLSSLVQGNPGPLMKNVIAGLGVFTFNGDAFWRYNIPGRPFLGPVMGALFYLGLLVTLWRLLLFKGYRPRAASYGLVIFWLAAGLSPVLVTGPDLSVTQAIGMQPVVYLFPALALVFMSNVISKSGRLPEKARKLLANRWMRKLAVLLLFGSTALLTARDYFVVWANAPEVRVQYESTMVATMRYLEEQLAGTVAISTVTPGRFHSPAVAQMTLHDDSLSLRWFDGRSSLLLPGEPESHIVVPGFAPIAPELAPYFDSARLIDTIPLRPDDLDRPVEVYQVDSAAALGDWRSRIETVTDDGPLPVNFGDAAELLGFELQTPSAEPGQEVRLVTLWRVKRPVEDALLFVHMPGTDKTPLAQVDQLDVPSRSWHPGDHFLQLHRFKLPEDLTGGDYTLVMGVCLKTASGCVRLSFPGGASKSNLLPLTTLVVRR